MKIRVDKKRGRADQGYAMSAAESHGATLEQAMLCCYGSDVSLVSVATAESYRSSTLPLGESVRAAGERETGSWGGRGGGG